MKGGENMPRTSPLNKQKDCLIKLFGHAMVDKGWNQRHLAEICDMSTAQISKILNDPENHKFTTIIMVAKKLGISEIPIIR